MSKVVISGAIAKSKQTFCFAKNLQIIFPTTTLTTPLLWWYSHSWEWGAAFRTFTCKNGMPSTFCFHGGIITFGIVWFPQFRRHKVGANSPLWSIRMYCTDQKLSMCIKITAIAKRYFCHWYILTKKALRNKKQNPKSWGVRLSFLGFKFGRGDASPLPFLVSQIERFQSHFA